MDVDIFNIEQWEKPTNIYDAVKMIRKIKDMFPIACIVWQPDDVIIYAEDHDPPYLVTEDEAKQVIKLMEDAQDCNYGITWDLLLDCLDSVTGLVVDEEPGLCSWCNGSGEGMHDGTTCTHCKGTGEVRRIE